MPCVPLRPACLRPACVCVPTRCVPTPCVPTRCVPTPCDPTPCVPTPSTWRSRHTLRPAHTYSARLRLARTHRRTRAAPATHCHVRAVTHAFRRNRYLCYLLAGSSATMR
eukprot:6212842-Pleurochrysis_carterae.AAC.1